MVSKKTFLKLFRLFFTEIDIKKDQILLKIRDLIEKTKQQDNGYNIQTENANTNKDDELIKNDEKDYSDREVTGNEEDNLEEMSDLEAGNYVKGLYNRGYQPFNSTTSPFSGNDPSDDSNEKEGVERMDLDSGEVEDNVILTPTSAVAVVPKRGIGTVFSKYIVIL